MKIQLINPPLDNKYSNCTRSGCFPPLDILTIASYILNSDPNTEVELLDGDIMSKEEILKRIDTNIDILGISPKVFSYESCLHLAKYAKCIGVKKIILGGSFSSALYRNILLNRDFIDAIVVGDGGRAISKLIHNVDSNYIPNLAYREGNSVILNNVETDALDYRPDIIYEASELNIYYKNYQQKFNNHPFSRALPYSSQKGCYWYDISGGCVFCRLQEAKNVRVSPKKFWTDISKLVNKYNAEMIWDVSDTFTSPLSWVEEIVESKPKNINPYFYLYARASDITEKSIRLFKNLGCYEILIGVESGNNKLLKVINKGINTKIILNAVTLCAKNNIEVFPTFLLGLPGETIKTLNDTVELAYELFSLGNIHEISSAILIPLSGSKIFNSLKNDILKLSDKDLIEYKGLQEYYIQNHTTVDMELLNNANSKINSLVSPELRSSFGLVNQAINLDNYDEKYKREKFTKEWK